MKAGWGDGYYGAEIDASVAVAKAEGSFVIGGDDLNVSANASAEALTADGKAAYKFEDDGQFAMGAKGEAALVKASADIGGSLISFSAEDDAGNSVEGTLFGVKAEGSVGIQASAGVYAESTTAYEFKYANVNATTLDVDLALVLGVSFSITVPTISLKWPW